MRTPDDLSPAQYRARYEALQAAARARAAMTPAAPTVAEIAPMQIIVSESIPAGCYVALRLRRGCAIRIVNVSGTPGTALFSWNADEPSERYNAGDTVKLQWTTNLTAGRVLFSDMGRVLAGIIADTANGHDCIIGPNSPAQAGSLRNGRDNLRLAAAKFGLTRRDVGPALSLFSPIRTDEAGRFHWAGPSAAGALVDLRADMNLLLAISNTPHALSPVQAATGPVEVIMYHPADGVPDPCRYFTEEASRGYMNNETYFAP